MTASFDAGDLYLVDETGQSFRLSWTGQEDGDARALALPAGEYVLKTYRIVRDRGDERWHVSATKESIQEVEVRAGENTVVEIDDSIRVSSKLAIGQAQMMIAGEHGAGLSIYRDGKRIPIEFRVVDEKGALLASGHMRYG